MENSLRPDNPYLGPNAFAEDQTDRFFGRSAEIRELTSLVIARRVVLLYAQSGAGKTSLIKAGLIPELKRREDIAILPIARVSGAGVEGGRNPYVASALTYLLPDGAPSGGTLKEGLRSLLADDTSEAPRLLILDQFEEIFTTYPERTAERAAFFEQLKESLDEFPQLTLLLSMREDYLANVLSYSSYLPDQLRTRMRLERLKFDAALAAIRGPAALKNKPFAAAVAEQLVDNLRRIQTSGRIAAQTEAGTRLGEYVEPVQLQIVCWRLWEKLPESAVSITAGDVDQHANVDDVLKDFYETALEAARKTSKVSRRKLRPWVGKHLITPARTRGLVYRGVRDTAGLPNAAVDSLEKSYLIRDARGGGEWYELTHDRLVEPILESNREHRQLSPWKMVAVGVVLLAALCIIWSVGSATYNRHLLQVRVYGAAGRLKNSTNEDLRAAGLGVGKEFTGCSIPSLTSMQNLDVLRQMLTWQDVGNSSSLSQYARNEYYALFRVLLLGSTQKSLVDLLDALPASPDPSSQDYATAYNSLKAYLLTTSHRPVYSSDADFLATTLYQAWTNCKPATVEFQSLVKMQFEFYAKELANGDLSPSQADAAAVANGRRYLAQFSGADRVYAALLGQAGNGHAPQSFNERFPGLDKEVVDGVAAPAAFTKDAFGSMTSLIRGSTTASDWVLEASALALDAAKVQALQAMYVTEYVRTWRDVLSKASLAPNALGPGTGYQTQQIGQAIVTLLCWVSRNTSVDSPDIQKAFQPVHLVTPPSSDGSCATAPTQAYLQSLMNLQVKIEAAQKGATAPTHQADVLALENTAALAVTQLMQGAKPDPVNRLDQLVRRLLLLPIPEVSTASPVH